MTRGWPGRWLTAAAVLGAVGLAEPGALAAASPAVPAVAAPLPIDSLLQEDLPRVRILAPDFGALAALRREAEFAANQFRRTMGGYPPKLGIAALGTLDDPSRVSDARLKLAGYDYVIRDWPAKPGVPRPTTPSEEATAWIEQPSERMSRWFLAAVERDQARGTPPEGRARHIPDWFESALAGLATSPSEQNRRVAWMHARIDQRVPTARFLLMARPAEAAAGAKTGAGGKRGASAAAITPRLFDAQALSFARFLGQREGERFLGLMIERVLLGEPQSAAFNIAKTMLSHPDVLEKEWVAWVKEQAGSGAAK